MHRLALALVCLGCAALPCLGADRPTDASLEAPTRVRPILAAEPAPLLPEDAAGPVRPYRALRLDDAAWRALQDQSVAWMDEVPLSTGETVDLRLTRLDPYAKGARIVVMETDANGRAMERELPRPEVSAWAGTVSGRPGSRVFIARSAAGLHGYIQFDGRSEIISSGDARGDGTPCITNAAALPPGDFSCGGGMPRPGGPPQARTGAAFAPPTAACRQLPVAFDTDQELLARFGGNTTTASAYVATLVAAVMDIYQRDFNCRPSLCYLRWWKTADPWTQTGTCGNAGADQLGELRSWWNANMSTQPRALTCLLSARSLGGGCAWLWATCENPVDGYGYAVCGNLAGSFPYPILNQNAGNWDLMVVAHELGHNVSAMHTHDIGVDGCGNGDCTLRLQGTIMSYCHLCTGGMSNMNMWFDPVNIPNVQDYLLNYAGCTAPEQADPVAMADTYSIWEGTPTVFDVLRNDLPSNCEAVSIDGLSATSALGVPLSVLPTGSPTGGPAILYGAGSGARGADTFSYRLRDASGQISSPVTVSVDVKPMLAATSGLQGDVPGLRGRYYALSNPASLPDFETLTPYQYADVPLLSFGATSGSCVGSGRSDNFGAVFEGWVVAPSEGNYTFSLTSDAGSRLVIDGFTVIDFDGLHAFTEKTGTVYMRAGVHALQVHFFENLGACGLQLKWAPPGTTTRVFVPAASLRHGGQVYDLDGSGGVDAGDLAWLLMNFGTDCTGRRCYGDPNDRQFIGFDPPCTCPEDLDGSGEVDAGDLALMLLAW